MKKLILLTGGIITVFIASAQISIGVAGNYYKFLEDYLNTTPGIQLRGSYEINKKFSMTVSYSSSKEMKKEAYIILMDYNSMQLTTVPSERKIKSKTILLAGEYTFSGRACSKYRMYGTAGVGIVFASVSEKNTESYDDKVYVPMLYEQYRDQKLVKYQAGFGGEYRIGRPSMFGEVNYAYVPKRFVSEYCENYHASHLLFSLGMRIPIN